MKFRKKFKWYPALSVTELKVCEQLSQPLRIGSTHLEKEICAIQHGTKSLLIFSSKAKQDFQKDWKEMCSSLWGQSGVFLHSLVLARGKREDQSIARMTVLAVALASWELGSAINLKSGTVCANFPTHISDSRGSDAFF